MVYALRPIRESQTSTHTLRVKFQPGKTFLVRSQHDILICYLYQQESPFLHLFKKLRFSHKIEALLVVNLGQKGELNIEGLLVYVRGEIHLVKYIESDLQIIQSALLDIKPVFQQRLESGPELICFQNGPHNIAVLHAYQGFLTFIDLDRILKKANKRKKSPVSWTPAIGFMVVKDLCWVALDVLTMALLSRDMEFNYSLYYYEIDMEAGSITSKQLKHHFKEAPAIIFPTVGGVCVASDCSLHFFPKYEPTDLSEKCHILKSLGNTRVVVDLKLCSLETQDMAWQAHVLVDDLIRKDEDNISERHLLVSDSGHTIMVYLEVSNKFLQTAVKDFRFMNLGKTTIASSLVHVESNVFFAPSMLSQSVLFRVLPRNPHVHVFGYIAASPPVLDMAICQEKTDDALIVAQGGFYSGELEKVSTRTTIVKSLQKVTLPHLALLAEYKGLTRDGLKFSATAFDKSNDYILSLDGEPTVQHIGAYDVELVGSISTTTADGSLVSTSGNILFFDLELLELPGLVDPTAIQVLKGKRSTDVLVCLSDNELYLVRYETELKLILKQKVPFVGHISVALHSLNNDILVIAVSSDGEIYQSVGNETKISRIPKPNGWARVKSSGTRNPNLLLMDSKNVWVLFQQRNGTFMNMNLVYSSSERISDCLMIGDGQQGTLVVFHGTPSVSVVEYHSPGLEDRVICKYYSKNTVLKVLKLIGSDDLLTIELEMDTSSGKLVRRTLLKLFNSQDLILKLTYVPLNVSNHSDFCQVFIPEEYQSSIVLPIFVVANNSDGSLETYFIKKKKIVLHNKVPYRKLAMETAEGYKPAIMAVQVVKFKDGDLTLVGDRILKLKLECIGDIISWSPISDHIASYGIGYDQIQGLGILADVVGGILVNNDKPKFLTPNFEAGLFKPFFPTALAAIESKNLVVFGDSKGNLGAFQISKSTEAGVRAEIIFATNLGDQINVIKAVDGDILSIAIGTVNGAIYSLEDLGEVDESIGLVAKRTFPWWLGNKETEQFGVLTNDTLRGTIFDQDHDDSPEDFTARQTESSDELRNAYSLLQLASLD